MLGSYIPPDTKEATAAWNEKLVGKKIGAEADASTFAERDLPAQARLMWPDSGTMCDFIEERMNVYLDAEGRVTHVEFG